MQQRNLPSTIGEQSLGAFYNEEGVPTGVRLLIEEPTMTVTLESARDEDFDVDRFFFDLFEPLETDGAEEVNFFLQSGEGYEVASDSGTEVIYYDSVEDVPESTGRNYCQPQR